MNFNCGRTCQALTPCRFAPVLAALGRGQTAFSHTTRVKVDFLDLRALRLACAALGAEVLGAGTHRLYGGAEVGFGVQLNGWRYPIIVRDDGTVAYDDFNGAWGHAQDIDILRGVYAIARAELAAQELGWCCERQTDGSLLVYHPSGGTLLVTADGVCDASGFVGSDCHVFEPIEEALGQQREVAYKPAFRERAHVTEGGR